MKLSKMFSIFLAPALVLAACGNDSSTASTDADSAGGDVPVLAVSTSILGDIVVNLFGDAVDVDVIMPAGVDPHDFQASAKDAARIRDAAVLVINGEGFEAGLASVIAGAESDGVVVHEAIEGTSELAFGDDEADHGDDDHAEDDHAEDDHAEDEADHDDAEGDGHDHDHGAVDPHFFTDPSRVAEAAAGIVDAVLAAVPDLDRADVRDHAGSYIAELEALDGAIEATLDVIPASDRVLVTNHEVFAYFADRYEFTIAGVIVPGGGTSESVSGGALDALVGVIVDAGVPAIFVDASSSPQLAETLAAEVGDVAVVELYTESLGEPGSDGATYIEMMTANAQRIAAALGA